MATRPKKPKRPSSPEAEQILNAYRIRHEATKRKSQRLGASQLGKPCERALWYGFRWAAQPDFDASTLQIFRLGHMIEAQTIKDMREGLGEVWEIDPATGEQFEFTDAMGHFVVKTDGLMSEGPLVVEIKSSSLEQYRKIHTDGCEIAKPEHYVQCQMGTGLARERLGEDFDALYVVVSKDRPKKKDEIRPVYTERLPFDPDCFAENRAKALRVIQAQEAPPKISEKSDFFLCSWCDHKEVCHGETVADVSCRTCVFSKPVAGGEWACEKLTKRLTKEEQEEACGEHLFIPDLIPYAKAVDSDEDAGWVQYRMENGTTFLNMGEIAFPPEQLNMGFAYSSWDLTVLPPDLVGDPVVEQIRDVLGATITAAVPQPVAVDGDDGRTDD